MTEESKEWLVDFVHDHINDDYYKDRVLHNNYNEKVIVYKDDARLEKFIKENNGVYIKKSKDPSNCRIKIGDNIFTPYKVSSEVIRGHKASFSCIDTTIDEELFHRVCVPLCSSAYTVEFFDKFKKIWYNDYIKNKRRIYMAEINGGTLYDMNKAIFANMKAMGDHDFNKQLAQKVENLLTEYDNTYYMLLCHEDRNYTLFSLRDMNVTEKVTEELKDCLCNRGVVYSIEKVDGGLEIWLKDRNKQFFCYYFFPADPLVIDIYGDSKK